MLLSDRVHTFGQWLKHKHGQRVHKIALDAGFTCPNRDGSKGTGGCTFCNNASFNVTVAQQRRNGQVVLPPVAAADTPIASPANCGSVSTTASDSSSALRAAVPLQEQLASGRRGIARGTRASKYLAYFQAYTNTYAHVDALKALYDEALAMDGMIGLSVGTRPDCVPDEVLDLLAGYRDQGMEVWLELGLQSAFDASLRRVNRGHGLAEYVTACKAARSRGIPVCTHLIVGLPGETAQHSLASLDVVLDIGTDGLKLHPLHVVKGTQLANEWRRGEYTPLSLEDYVSTATDLIERTPPAVVYHRVTGTAPARLLLTPQWCAGKWPVLNAIVAELQRRGTRQGSHFVDSKKGYEGLHMTNSLQPQWALQP